MAAEARDQFRNWLASNGARQIGIGPGACDIVEESETIGRGQSDTCYAYTLTRFLRNRDGHYVMFKSTPSGPYVKLVEASVARIVLKRKYVEPGA